MFKLKTNNKEIFDYLKNNKQRVPTQIDKINNFFVILEYKKEQIKISFDYICLANDNKLKGMPYIDFEIYCSSNLKGYCMLGNSNLCYSCRDQKRFKAVNYKIILNVLFFKEVQRDLNLYKKVVKYLSNFKFIRFNRNNDLNNKFNIDFLIKLANDLKSSQIAGYTNRFDLLESKKDIKYIPKNLIINGSNYMLVNCYTVLTTFDLYFKANYKCKGLCKDCYKCYNLKNKEICTLLHGPIVQIDKYYQSKANRTFLIKFFDKYLNIKLSDEDLNKYKGLVYSLNKALELQKIDLKFKSIKELVTLIEVQI